MANRATSQQRIANNWSAKITQHDISDGHLIAGLLSALCALVFLVGFVRRVHEPPKGVLEAALHVGLGLGIVGLGGGLFGHGWR